MSERVATVQEAAKYFKRSPQMIRQWCRNGTLLAFNYRVIREKNTRWLIVLPN
jgi:hypothetical protein